MSSSVTVDVVIGVERDIRSPRLSVFNVFICSAKVQKIYLNLKNERMQDIHILCENSQQLEKYFFILKTTSSV